MIINDQGWVTRIIKIMLHHLQRVACSVALLTQSESGMIKTVEDLWHLFCFFCVVFVIKNQ